MVVETLGDESTGTPVGIALQVAVPDDRIFYIFRAAREERLTRALNRLLAACHLELAANPAPEPEFRARVLEIDAELAEIVGR